MCGRIISPRKLRNDVSLTFHNFILNPWMFECFTFSFLGLDIFVIQQGETRDEITRKYLLYYAVRKFHVISHARFHVTARNKRKYVSVSLVENLYKGFLTFSCFSHILVLLKKRKKKLTRAGFELVASRYRRKFKPRSSQHFSVDFGSVRLSWKVSVHVYLWGWFWTNFTCHYILHILDMWNPVAWISVRTFC